MSGGESPGGAGLEPRSFLDAILGVGVVATAVSFLDPACRFLVPPRRGEAAAVPCERGAPPTSRPTPGAIVQSGTRPAIVVGPPDGQFRAFSAVCTHLDRTVHSPDSRCSCRGSTGAPPAASRPWRSRPPTA